MPLLILMIIGIGLKSQIGCVIFACTYLMGGLWLWGFRAKRRIETLEPALQDELGRSD
jgi:hypothetical protein